MTNAAASASPLAMMPQTIGLSLRTPDSALSEVYLLRRMMRPVRQQEKIAYEFTHDVGYLHQYHLMRDQVYSQIRGLSTLAGQQDRFDTTSEIMVARMGLQCVAGGRLTISTAASAQEMPMEGDDLRLKNLFPELDLANRAYGEFSRLAILPEFRGGAVFPEIARRFIRKAIAEGVEYAFNMASLPSARAYRQMVESFGFKWDVREDIEVPDREEYEGVRMVISVMDLTRFARNKRSASTVANVKIPSELLAD